MPNSKDLNKKSPRKFNKKSLETLKPLVGEGASERARAMQKKSVAARNRNKEQRERLAAIAGAVVDKTKAIESSVPPAIEVMRVCMIEALDNEDYERAAQFANMIAPYEQPKLASQSIDITERNVKDLSDAELAKEAKALGIDYKNVVSLVDKK